MRINNNIMAMNTYRQLTNNTFNTSKSLEKLSSGLRINRAGDDAAGLAISEKMRGQIRGLEQANRNAQDGISLIQTAEGALNETQAILQRMRELAVQAANDTNTADDRAEIQKEIDQLTQEIDRIGNATEFNTKKLLNGSATVSANISDSDGTDSSELVIVGGTGDTQAGASITIDDINAATAASDVTTATFANASTTLSGPSVLTINGTQFSFDSTNTVQNVLDTINNAGIGVTATFTDGAGITISSNNVGSAASFTVSTATGDFVGIGSATGTDASLTAGYTGFTQYTAKGDVITIQDGSAKGLSFKLASGGDLDPTNDTTITVANNGGLFMQIGANEDQNMYVSISDMRSAALGVSGIDVSTQSNANSAITTIDDAIKTVSSERSKLGAYQNRLEKTINNLSTSAENLTAAESRIRDADLAKEMMAFTKNNILQQAAQAMLAQLLVA
ncbi:flagellin [Microaerobacter geothermalis]|uniref:flagellin N-terminal helical domain-containing protein n=1 Tax=Microaerobacter geothermalis TaxID=674972 RepID=UPI001F27BF9A|nr:flagellin [Microaerobacter geothermalis]MCF6093421.1 flagellin [Microaerobacter geothermalis]